MTTRRIILVLTFIVTAICPVVIFAPMIFPYIANGVCAIWGLFVGISAAAYIHHHND